MARKKTKGENDNDSSNKNNNSNSWSEKLLKDLFERRGIEYDKNKKVSELFNLNRSNVYGLEFEKEQEIKIISTPEKIVERVNQASVIYQLVTSETSSKGYSERKQLSGHPSIHLYFKQISPLQEGQKSGLKSEFSLRVIKKAEYKDENGPEAISIAFLKEKAQKIKSLFIEPTLFNLKRGELGYSYQDWPRGYATWSDFLDENSAFEFFEKYVQILGDTFDKTKVGVNPHTYKQKGTKKVNVLGEETKLPTRYRKVTMALHYAYCKLPITGKKIILATRSTRFPVDFRLKE